MRTEAARVWSYQPAVRPILLTTSEYTSRNELRNINNGVSGNSQPLFTYSYDASGNVTQRLGRTLQGDTTTTVCDGINRATDCTHAINGTNFSVSHYDYSGLGNLKDVIRSSSPYEDGKGDYFNAYDDGNELTAAVYSATSSTDSNPGKSVSYSVLNKRRDSMNVTDNTVAPSTTNSYVYVHNDINQYSKIVVNGTDRLLQHDYNFNLTTYNGWTYSYDAENRLISAGGGHSAQFAYDAVGRCVRRTIDGATTVLTYDQWTPVVEWDGSGNLIATNIYGLGADEILYRVAGSTQLYFKSDPMGNVRFLLNGSGAIIEKNTYDAFGRATIMQFNGSQPTGNRFMFSGREYFSTLGLYDMRNRIYDPVMGRFYQIDPIGFAGDPTNLYRFCGNNPLLGGDPTGLFNDISFDYSAPVDFNLAGGGDSSAIYAGADAGVTAWEVANTYYPFGDHVSLYTDLSSDQFVTSVKSFTAPQFTDGINYPFREGSSLFASFFGAKTFGGHFQTVGVQTMAGALELFGTAGWDASKLAAFAAADSAIKYNNGTEGFWGSGGTLKILMGAGFTQWSIPKTPAWETLENSPQTGIEVPKVRQSLMEHPCGTFGTSTLGSRAAYGMNSPAPTWPRRRVLTGTIIWRI